MAQDRDMARLFYLADQKLYAVSRTAFRSDVRLIDADGQCAKQDTGAAGFTIAEAIRFLESQPDRKALAAC